MGNFWSLEEHVEDNSTSDNNVEGELEDEKKKRTKKFVLEGDDVTTKPKTRRRRVGFRGVRQSRARVTRI